MLSFLSRRCTCLHGHLPHGNTRFSAIDLTLRNPSDFLNAVSAGTFEEIPARIGHQGYTHGLQKVRWAAKLGIWIHSEFLHRRKYYWNAFGVKKPRPGGAAEITTEINSPLSGINRRIAGAFARNEEGNLLLVHRGKIGGGRKGIGKALFEERYKGEWVTALDDGVQSRFALIGALDSRELGQRISRFVHEVDAMKRSRSCI